MDMRSDVFRMLIVVLVFIIRAVAASPKDDAELCQNQQFHAQCSQGEVVMMTKALYGRMRVNECVDRDYGYIGCKADVLSQADSLCSGRRTCDIDIPEPSFDEMKPCPTDLKSYFQASYVCLPVLDIPNAACDVATELELTAPSGRIASVLTAETGLGSSECPWVIKVKVGQIVNITMLDFGVHSSTMSGCQAYAIVRDPVNRKTICGGKSRESTAFVSQGNRVEIRIVNPKSRMNQHFVLNYKVIGCNDPEAPDGATVTREDENHATVTCGITGETWQLKCEGSTWQGHSNNNCTHGGHYEESVFGEVNWGSHTIPFGSSMIIVVAIALSLGIIILIIGLSILKWKRNQNYQRRGGFPPDNQYQTTYKVPSADPSRPVQVSTDQDTFYQAPENEYAYISDFPHPDNIQDQNLSNRHMELYKARKCYDYGTAPNPPSTARPQNPNIRQGAQSRKVDGLDKTDRRLADLHPTYFELDPDDPKQQQQQPSGNSGSGIGEYKKMVVNNNCSIGAHGVESGSAAMRRANQSTHDFVPTSHDLMDSTGNNSHKSV